MSELGRFDILNELGKNIIIYPLDRIIIKDFSIDLSASRFAWSLTTKKSLVTNNKIIIPPQDTAIIFTNESIYVSEKLCGTYHSKVSLVSKGISHISTTLDPYFIGISKLSITNCSNNNIVIDVGSPIVSIMFYYLKTSSKNSDHYTSKEFITCLSTYPNYSDFNKWIETNNWIFNRQELYNKMTTSEKYRSLKNDLKYQNKLTLLTSHPIFVPATAIILSLVYFFISNIIFHSSASFTNSVIFPIITYCALEIISGKNKR